MASSSLSQVNEVVPPPSLKPSAEADEEEFALFGADDDLDQLQLVAPMPAPAPLPDFKPSAEADIDDIAAMYGDPLADNGDMYADLERALLAPDADAGQPLKDNDAVEMDVDDQDLDQLQSVPPMPAPQAQPVYNRTVFGMDSFFTTAPITKDQRAFNLLGCIVFLSRFPSTSEGWQPVYNVFGLRLEVLKQITEFVNDPQRGVVHNSNERSVAITRRHLTDLVRGSGIPVEQDKILYYFTDGKSTAGVTDANIRKYFSGLVRSWERNVKRGGRCSKLNTFEYDSGKSKQCFFKFFY